MSTSPLHAEIDTAAIKEATEALDRLAEAADRAGAAMAKLGLPSMITVNIDGSAEFDTAFDQARDSIRKGARRTDHRFRV